MIHKLGKWSGEKIGDEDPVYDPKVGKIWKSVGCGQEQYTKPQQDVVEDKFIKCFEDIT